MMMTKWKSIILVMEVEQGCCYCGRCDVVDTVEVVVVFRVSEALRRTSETTARAFRSRSSSLCLRLNLVRTVLRGDWCLPFCNCLSMRYYRHPLPATVAQRYVHSLPTTLPVSSILPTGVEETKWSWSPLSRLVIWKLRMYYLHLLSLLLLGV